MRNFLLGLILAALCFAVSGDAAFASRGKTGHAFHVPTGYVQADEAAYASFMNCLKKQHIFQGERVWLLLPEGSGNAPLPAVGGRFAEHVLLLSEKRDEPLDRVDFISLKESLRERVEAGGIELQGLLPEGICDSQGRLLRFSDQGEARLIREGEESFSWLYLAGVKGSESSEQRLMLMHTIRLTAGDLLHVYHAGAALDENGANFFILKAKDVFLTGNLQLRGDFGGSIPGVDQEAGQSALFFFLALLLFSAVVTACFWIKRSHM